MNDRIVSPLVAKARGLWRMGNAQTRPDAAERYREGARYYMRLARYARDIRSRTNTLGTVSDTGRVK